MGMDISLLIIAMALSTSIQTCQINGIPTYTDRSDVCDESTPVDLSNGTFSVVDPWVAPTADKTAEFNSSQPQLIVVTHYIERPVYLPQNLAPIHYPIHNRRFERRHPSYPYLPDLRPNLYRDRVGYAIMPHQRPQILGKRYQSGRNPALGPLAPIAHWPHSIQADKRGPEDGGRY